MSRLSHRPFFRLALIGSFLAALALAGCGRKGPLDLPPSTASATGQQKTANTDLIRSPLGPAAKKTETAAPQTPKKHFILDPLLN